MAQSYYWRMTLWHRGVGDVVVFPMQRCSVLEVMGMPRCYFSVGISLQLRVVCSEKPIK